MRRPSNYNVGTDDLTTLMSVAGSSIPVKIRSNKLNFRGDVTVQGPFSLADLIKMGKQDSTMMTNDRGWIDMGKTGRIYLLLRSLDRSKEFVVSLENIGRGEIDVERYVGGKRRKTRRAQKRRAHKRRTTRRRS
jgi:hypothetical protein